MGQGWKHILVHPASEHWLTDYGQFEYGRRRPRHVVAPSKDDTLNRWHRSGSNMRVTRLPSKKGSRCEFTCDSPLRVHSFCGGLPIPAQIEADTARPDGGRATIRCQSISGFVISTTTRGVRTHRRCVRHLCRFSAKPQRFRLASHDRGGWLYR